MMVNQDVIESWSISQTTNFFCNKAQLALTSDTPAHAEFHKNHKPDQVSHTKNQVTDFHGVDSSNNTCPWKKPSKVAAARVSGGGGEEGEFCNVNSFCKYINI